MRSPCPTAILYQELFLSAMRFSLFHKLIGRFGYVLYVACSALVGVCWGVVGLSCISFGILQVYFLLIGSFIVYNVEAIEIKLPSGKTSYAQFNPLPFG